MLRIFDLCYLNVNFIIHLLTIELKTLSILLLMLVSLAVHSQGELDALLATTADGASRKAQAKEQLKKFVEPLTTSGLSEQKLLRKTFRRLHSTLLKKYEAYSDFDEVFSSGRYDCLTATALFSQVLSQLNFSYKIIETNYHIFLLVQTANGEVLLETTDRFGGFVTDKETIAQRTSDYCKNALTVDNSRRFFYRYSFNLYQKLSPEKLTGLLYFNQAVKAYNRHEWLSSAILLQKANALYASPRCEALGSILIKTALESSLDQKAKSDCLVYLKNFWIKKSEPLASN